MSTHVAAPKNPRLAGDAGATLVEAAFALPIILFLVMGMLDLGLAELRNSQVTSAARDGARVGVIQWNGADQGTYSGGACPAVSTTPPVVSASFNAICNAVLQRMAGSAVTSVTVTCYVSTTNTVPAGGCAKSPTGKIVEGLDMIQVTASSVYTPVTPTGRTFMGSSKTFTSSARMVIQ